MNKLFTRYFACIVIQLFYIFTTYTFGNTGSGLEVYTDIQAEYNNSISIVVTIKNNSSTSFSNTTFKYFLNNSEHSADVQAHLDWSNISGVGVSVIEKPDDIVEAVFDIGNCLHPGSEVNLHIRFNTENWQDMDYTNDFSYQGIPSSPGTVNTKVALFQNDVLIYGTVPSGDPVDPEKSLEAKTVIVQQYSNSLGLIAYIKNTGTVPLNNIEFKYFLDPSDHSAPLQIAVDWTDFPNVAASTEEGPLNVLVAVFNMGDYSLGANEERQIHLRLYLDGYPSFDYTNDYSYLGIDPNNPNQNVAVCSNGILFGGTKPYTRDDDNDRYPYAVEIELGTDPNDPGDIPQAALPNGGDWQIDTEERNVIDFDFENIPGYSSGKKVRITLDGSPDMFELAPVISQADADDYDNQLPDLPPDFEYLGPVLKVQFEKGDESDISFAFPYPDGGPKLLSKRFFRLYHHTGDGWEEISIDYATEDALHFSSELSGVFSLASVIPYNVRCVDQSVAASGDGKSWDQAYKTLLEVLDNPPPRLSEIWVAQGTYFPSLDPVNETDRTKTFEFPDKLQFTLLGGFPEGGSIEDKRDYKAFETVLSGDIGVQGDKSDNIHQIVRMSGSGVITIDGFSILNGNANGAGGKDKGAGIYVENNPESVYINRCTFRENEAYVGGAIFSIENDRVQISQCIFEENYASNSGGAIWCFNSTQFNIFHCNFTGNEAGDEGGCLYDNRASSQVKNCVFKSNKAKKGAAIYLHTESKVNHINHNTFFGNSATEKASTIVLDGYPNTFRIYNNIFWGNPGMVFIIYCKTGLFRFNHNCISGGASRIDVEDAVDFRYGDNNLTVDPLFVDPPMGRNLELSPSSPCIDAANGNYGWDYDINLVVRYDVPSVSNTGVGDPDYADIGAYELSPVRFENVTGQVGLHNEDGFRISVADVNNDGYPDLLMHKASNEGKVETPLGEEDVLKKARLYLNVVNTNPNSSCSRMFVDYTQESNIWDNWQGTNDGRHTSFAIFGDVDNDGDVDMYTGAYHHRNPKVANHYNSIEIRINDGNGHFSLPTEPLKNALSEEQQKINNSCAVFCDYNLDGNIDLFVGGWYFNISEQKPFNQMLLNGNGDGTFELSTSFVGENGCFYGISAADVNTDGSSEGYFELFAPTYSNGSLDKSLSYHWENRSGTDFTNYAGFYGPVSSFYGSYLGAPVWDHWPQVVETAAKKSSMGSMPRDYDNDGDVDLLELVLHGADGGIHTTVLTNDGYSFVTFSWDFDKMKNRSETDGKPKHNRDHIGHWVDIDNDGLSDIVISENGSDASNRVYIFKQDENNDFINVSTYCGDLRHINDSEKPPLYVIPLDYDLDGDEDLIVGYGSTDAVSFLENKTGNRNNWLIVSLVGNGTNTNKSAIGAKVEVEAGGTTYTRYVSAGDGHMGPQKPFDLVFGLGRAWSVDRIKVTWPNVSRSTTVLTGQSINQRLVITQ